MDPEKIKAIWEWEVLKIKKGVRTFLRFANYYKAFIDKFATTVTLFTAFTGKHPFLWIPDVTGRVACKQMVPKDERTID